MTDNIKAAALAAHPILRFFEFQHLPERLQTVSEKFHDLAWYMIDQPYNEELCVSLRKLLEAKDAAARSALLK